MRSGQAREIVHEDGVDLGLFCSVFFSLPPGGRAGGVVIGIGTICHGKRTSRNILVLRDSFFSYSFSGTVSKALCGYLQH